MNKQFMPVAENDNFIVEYNEELNLYRVSYFEDNHFVDEFHFYGNKQANTDSSNERNDNIEEYSTAMITNILYNLCGQQRECEECPLIDDAGKCPNFLESSREELVRLYHLMQSKTKDNTNAKMD